MGFQTFRLHLYVCPELAVEGPPIVIEGASIPTLICPGISQTRFQCSFEQIAERLQALERLAFEMDGSFVWAGELDDGVVWQFYGMLYDYGDRLQRVELTGMAPGDRWQRLLKIFADASHCMVAQLLDYHCFVDAKLLQELWPSPRTASKSPQ